jgi:hypothetical protein
LQAKISCFVNAGSLSAMFNLKTSSKRQLIFLSFFTWIMVVLNNKYVDMFNLESVLIHQIMIEPFMWSKIGKLGSNKTNLTFPCLKFIKNTWINKYVIFGKQYFAIWTRISPFYR